MVYECTIVGGNKKQYCLITKNAYLFDRTSPKFAEACNHHRCGTKILSMTYFNEFRARISYMHRKKENLALSMAPTLLDDSVYLLLSLLDMLHGLLRTLHWTSVLLTAALCMHTEMGFLLEWKITN